MTIKPSFNFSHALKALRGQTPGPGAAMEKWQAIDKKSKKRFIRSSLIAGNVLLLLLVSVFILANRSASQTVRASTLSSVDSTAASMPNPLDQLSSAQIA